VVYEKCITRTGKDIVMKSMALCGKIKQIMQHFLKMLYLSLLPKYVK
jgi:hypothetical protein